MDAITGLLDGPRARQAFLLRLIMSPPWSIWVDDRAPLCIVVVLSGEAWVTPPESEPVKLVPGDIAIIRGPDPYGFSFPKDTPPQVIALPGGECTTPEGESIVDAFTRGIRTWGNDPNGGTEVLVGSYEHVSELGSRLLAALPRHLKIHASDLETPLVDVMRGEITKNYPGQQAVLDRILDLLVVSVLRTWFGQNSDVAPGWFQANSDPLVGPALKLLEESPAQPWTVASLAAEVGCSRATLARRFSDLVGEPPMAYLTERRLALAADLLLEPDTTIAAVADRVGYSTPFALSTAFKRFHGHSPRQHQQQTAQIFS